MINRASISVNPKIIGLFIICFVCITSFVHAESIGGYASDYLEYGIFARSSSMGNAGRTLSGGPSAAFYNSALLAQSNSLGLAYAYTGLLADTSCGYFGLGSTLGDWHWAVNALIIKTGGIEVHTNPLAPNFTPEGYTDAANELYIIGLGRNFTDSLDLGLSAKFQRRGLGDSRDEIYSLDAGFLWNLGWLQIGPVFRNLLVNKTGDTSDEFKPDIDIGFQFNIFEPLLLVVDATRLLDKPSRYYLGAEYILLGGKQSACNLSLRGGGNENETSAGLGLCLGFIRIDYAYVMHNLESQHRYTFMLNWE
ncbi:MAG: hypothetical protein PHV30_11830 [Candidatus Margulisbacteria bacterium]|nr:hypothetical protein [Candidatus Margulisiibacteriota bacterium]